MTILTPMKAIRKKCLECSNGQSKEVRMCPLNDCALYPYRMGHRPKEAAVIRDLIKEDNEE